VSVQFVIPEALIILSLRDISLITQLFPAVGIETIFSLSGKDQENGSSALKNISNAKFSGL
jgi:hypothetical protein